MKKVKATREKPVKANCCTTGCFSHKWIIAVIVVVLIIAAVSFAVKEKREWRRYDGSKYQDILIKTEVQTAVSMLDYFYGKTADGTTTFEQAKLEAADALRQLRYGDDKTGYFWADTTEGVNVVLYGKADVEGKNRYNDHVNGVYYVRNILEKGMNGGGYTDYYYPKINGEEPKEKRAYSMVYEPFGWVVGTGYYIEDAGGRNNCFKK